MNETYYSPDRELQIHLHANPLFATELPYLGPFAAETGTGVRLRFNGDQINGNRLSGVLILDRIGEWYFMFNMWLYIPPF